jgi:PKD repeat protein
MKRALITTAIALLVLPALASANTITVSPGQSIAAAVNSANDGDTVHVLAGVYPEQPITVGKKITLQGDAGTIVTNAFSDATKSLITVTADGATLTTMTVASTVGPVVTGQGKDLAISDVFVLSTAGPGPALQLSGGGTDTLLRSSVAALATGADAVDVQSTGSAAVALGIDSSILSGGANAASLRAATSNTVPGTVGDITVSAVHATIAGAATAIAAQAGASGLLSPTGNVTVTVDRSIVRGAVTKTTCGCLQANASTVTITKSDTTSSDVFVNSAARNFHLRADATSVIDQGGPQVNGESATDVDGQPRVVGAASDLGADEFVNQPPTGRLAAPAAARTPNATTFDASASTDPEAGAGGGIAGYHFDFGDGTSADSNTPVVSHAYAKPGTYNATVTVTDAQGLAGAASAPVQAQVTDGIAPSARIISPRNGKKLKLRGPIRFTGTASDDTAVAAMGLTLQRVGSKKVTKIRVPIAQGIWSYKASRKKLKLKRGRYVLKAYAVDLAGNVSNPASVHFTLK